MKACRFALILCVTLFLCMGQGCPVPGTNDSNEDTSHDGQQTPPFISALIAQMQSEPVANPPASVTRYVYNGQVAYYVPPRCCDIPGVLYDADGNIICMPDGGFTGSGDGRCPDFFTARTSEQLIWADSRQ